MILFLGCSFTWGAGLQYEYLHNEENVSFDYINKNLIPPNYFLEHCSYKADKYRQEKHFPNLIAKHFNSAYCLGKSGNGGNNNEIERILNDFQLRNLGGQGQCKLIVVQFTDWQRSLEPHPRISDLIEIEKIIEFQVNQIVQQIQHFGVKNWVGISWFEDIGKFLKTKFPKNYVPIYANGVELTGFENLCQKNNPTKPYTLWGWSNEKIDDMHFNSYGHEFIAKQIIRKIEENNLL